MLLYELKPNPHFIKGVLVIFCTRSLTVQNHVHNRHGRTCIIHIEFQPLLWTWFAPNTSQQEKMAAHVRVFDLVISGSQNLNPRALNVACVRIFQSSLCVS